MYNGYKPDILSAEWRKMKPWLEEELLTCYKKLGALDIEEARAHQLRGEISRIKKILAFDKPAATAAPLFQEE